MDQEGMLKPALIGGIILGILSAIPVVSAVNCMCCLWVVGGGVLAAHFFVRSSPIAVTLGRGVLLGLITGAIGAVVDTIFSIPLHLALSGLGMGFAEQMKDLIERMPSVPPETREALRSVFASGAGVGAAFWILASLLKLFIYSLFAMLGGAIGVALFEKRKPGAPGMGAPVNIQPPTNWPGPPPPPTNPL